MAVINKSQRGTGTFVDETTVLSCAHMFVYKNSMVNYGGLSRNVEFYPGSDTYSGNGAIDYNNFGYYKPTKTYLPISYSIFESDNESYDWAINMTSAAFEGTETQFTQTI